MTDLVWWGVARNGMAEPGQLIRVEARSLGDAVVAAADGFSAAEITDVWPLLVAGHWHVRRHGEDEDPYVGDLPGALDEAARWVAELADAQHTLVGVCGEQGQYEQAYSHFQRSERWTSLVHNLRNMHRQHTVPPFERAPLYQAGDEEANAKLDAALAHVLTELAQGGPRGLAVWSCDLIDCAPVVG